MLQQFWLYFYGMLVACGVHMATADSAQTWQDFSDLAELTLGVKIWLAMALFFGSLGGVIVATILKRLDNIVKEYSSATANLFTAIVCSLLFPEKFMFTVFIFISMIILFLGVYLYEKKAKPVPTRGDEKKYIVIK